MKRRVYQQRKAFTLIEIMLVVALTGIIAALALAPVVYAVRQVVETETTYANGTVLRRTISFMAQDVAAGLRLTTNVVRVIDHEELGGKDDDTLIVASSAPAKQNLPAGSVVYKLVRRSVMNSRLIPGLYRWLLPGVMPEKVDHEKLEEKDGQLVAPYITGLKLAVLEPPDWSKQYDGAVPRGIRFTLSREEESVEYVLFFAVTR